MSGTGLDTFDSTVQKTNEWLEDLGRRIGTGDRHAAYLALRAVLHALRDRLTPEEAAHLGAQFPMLVRGFYFEGWRPAGKPLRERRLEDFLAHVRSAYRDPDSVDAKKLARAVFALLDAHVSPGEIADIRHILPAELRSLWR